MIDDKSRFALRAGFWFYDLSCMFAITTLGFSATSIKSLKRWILGSSPRMTVERFSSSEIHSGPSAGLGTFNRIACFADLAGGIQLLLRVILGLDPRIHLSTGLRVPGRDNADAAALATVRQPLNHPASR
ncbi:hypothetical protein ASF91_08370 [Rhizobium sp. Leaf155]|nr:hypothetical protein ASF91_08370 [Rhizobium sp. Leaf155]